MATGSVCKRGKHWFITISMGYIDGKQKRKRWTSKALTKAEAVNEMNNKLYELNRKVNTGTAPDNDYQLSTLFDTWKKHIDTTVNNPTTNADYKRYIERIIAYLPSEINIRDLTPQLLDQVLSRMTESFSNNSINKSLARLKAMLNYAVERSIIARNPITVVKALPKKQVFFKRALSVEEAQTLIATAPEKWSILWRFILSTGLRKQEVIQLKWDNIDFSTSVVRVLPTDNWSPKTEESSRTIPLTDKVIEDLKKLKKSRINEYVFVTQNGTTLKNNILRELKIHMKRAFCNMKGLAYGKRLNKKESEKYKQHEEWIEKNLKMINVHALRYTFCTHLLGNGVDIKTVQKLMGHSSPDVTLSIYAQYCHGNAENAMKKLPW